MEEQNKPKVLDVGAELTRILNEELLLIIYNNGWEDCFTSIDNSENYYGMDRTAYNLGWSHAIMGDDLSHIDYYTNDEILKIIKDTYESNKSGK